MRAILINANVLDPVVGRRSLYVRHRASYSALIVVHPGLICGRQYVCFQTTSFRVMRAVGAFKRRTGRTVELRADNVWRCAVEDEAYIRLPA